MSFANPVLAISPLAVAPRRPMVTGCRLLLLLLSYPELVVKGLSVHLLQVALLDPADPDGAVEGAHGPQMLDRYA